MADEVKCEIPHLSVIPNAWDDHCPWCGLKARIWCRCPTNHRTCSNGHTWHWEHGKRVESVGHGA